MVVKFGTESLFGGTNRLDKKTFDDCARQIALLCAESVQIVVVSSGAIRAGVERVQEIGKSPEDFTKKELASIGTRHIFNKWGDAFEKYRIDIAPVLVTYANWENMNERESVRKSILGAASKGMVPVINENDVVSDEEIKLMEKGISENDRLARMIAALIGADGLFFVTSAGGVFEKDPGKHADAQRYLELDHRKACELPVCVNSASSKSGRGGIGKKIFEAVSCKQELKRGARIVIGGATENGIVRFAHGEDAGTVIGSLTRM